MTTPPSTLQSLTTLLRQISLDDHEEVLKAANAVLKKSKTEMEALHLKVVALLKLDRYEDALRVVEEGGDSLKERAALEWAYALYKVGRYTDAEAVSKKAGRGSRGLRHVEAQTVRLLRIVPIEYWNRVCGPGSSQRETVLPTRRLPKGSRPLQTAIRRPLRRCGERGE
jgi:hypothetical protein